MSKFTELFKSEAPPLDKESKRAGILIFAALILGSFLYGTAYEKPAPEAPRRSMSDVSAEVISQIKIPVDYKPMIAVEMQDRPEVVNAMITFVTARGYRCDTLTSAYKNAFSRGLTLKCNNHRYEYVLSDTGGRWGVEVVR